MKKILSEDQKLNKAEYARQWRKDNPEAAAEHARKSRIKNKEKMRNKQLLKSFGITIEQYNAMLLNQKGRCALCGNGPEYDDKSFAVDHCHKTGKVRAILCRGCNVGIGNLRDDPELLIKAAEYIKIHS